MCKKEAVRFRHHFLINGGVLTVCTSLNHDTGNVKVGWSLFNPGDEKWVRKIGNEIARRRLAINPLIFTITDHEPIICDYISLRALLAIIGTSKRTPHNEIPLETTKIIPRGALASIQYEAIKILNLLGQRVGLESITE